jgi:UDP:flavonoid glycosyltransferase YjiC (YdhE family)
MKISIVVYGTRGDVQPMLALANAFKNKGHEILFCANPENENLVKNYNCNFIPFGPNVKDQLKISAETKKSPDSFSSLKGLKQEIEKQVALLPNIIKGSDLVLGAGIVFGVRSATEIADIPFRLIVFYPSALGPGKEGSFLNRLKYNAGMSGLNTALKGTINKKRIEFGMSPIKNVIKNFGGDHVIVASDVALNVVKEGVKAKYTQTGYMFLPPKNELPENVKDFIASGKPPVFISFGSNPISEPNKITNIFNRVSAATHQRLIVSKGWAELASVSSSSDILYVDDMPYETLFPQMAAIIHHGGTGTVASAAKAGVPQAAFPYMFDQFENHKQIIKLGLSPKTCIFKKLSDEALSAAIMDCVTNEQYKINAKEIAKKINNRDGLQLTVKLIEEEFNK